jgi:hypothetical protein
VCLVHWAAWARNLPSPHVGCSLRPITGPSLAEPTTGPYPPQRTGVPPPPRAASAFLWSSVECGGGGGAPFVVAAGGRLSQPAAGVEPESRPWGRPETNKGAGLPAVP